MPPWDSLKGDLVEGFLGFVVGDNLGTPCVSLKRIPWKDLRFSCGV